jgi:hypothetical protein
MDRERFTAVAQAMQHTPMNDAHQPPPAPNVNAWGNKIKGVHEAHCHRCIPSYHLFRALGVVVCFTASVIKQRLAGDGLAGDRTVDH